MWSSNSNSESEISQQIPRASPNDPSENAFGLSNPKLSQGRRRMLDLVNRLLSTGVQVDIDLPQIAVIGSQSSGKSSLIESISGIKLPRASGTCTRCPLECRLARSDRPWQCTVSLRFITDPDGQPLGQARNEQFGDVIYDKDKIEDRIRRAQFAILNPKTPATWFLKNNMASSMSELSFSLNAVTLQISGPDVADLSFCDLPGLIASISSNGRSHKDDIALVENLAATYIKKKSCIILLTVACETDFENQGAHSLAKKYDPEGTRTIGVLTKPDRIPMGEENNWLPFIRNEKERLKHNWFCVKQPSSNDLKLNLTWTGARKMENDFFTHTAPWCTLDSEYQRYLRTGNLVDRLSSVLSELISERLPPIQVELESSIRTTRNLLAKLPRPPSADPRSEIAALLHAFTSDLSLHVEGVPDDKSSTFGKGIGLIQAIRPAQERFKRMIRATEPNFKPYKRSEEGKKRLDPPTFLQNEESDDEASDIDIDEEGIQTEQGDEEKGKNGGKNDDDEVDDKARGNEKEGKQAKDDKKAPPKTESLRPESSAGTQLTGKKRKEAPDDAIYIEDVLERANRARTRELPGSFPYAVQKTFITKYTEEWKDPADMLCETIYATVLEQIQSLVRKHFSQFGQGSLERKIKFIMERHLKHCQEEAKKKVQWVLGNEDTPFTLNTHYLADYKDKFYAYYKAAREKDRDSSDKLVKAIQRYENPPSSTPDNGASTEASGITKILTGLAELGVTSVEPGDLAKLLPPDPMEPALVIMAEVRAYFRVAYKRIVDNVPLTIDRELVRGAARDILQILYENLGIDGVDGERICRDYASESSEVAARRADLQKKLERLQTASEELLIIRV